MKLGKLPSPPQFLFISFLLLTIYGLGIRIYKYLTWEEVFFNLQYAKPLCRQVNINITYQNIFGIDKSLNASKLINVTNDQLNLKLLAGTRTINLQYCPQEKIPAQKIWLASGNKTINYALTGFQNNQEFTHINTNTEYFYNRILRFGDYYYWIGIIILLVTLVWFCVYRLPHPWLITAAILFSLYVLFYRQNIIQLLKPGGYSTSGIIAYLQMSDSVFLSDLVNICFIIAFPGLSLLAVTWFDKYRSTNS